MIDEQENIVITKYGEASVTMGTVDGKKIAFIARHGKNHRFLPNMINFRANIVALKKMGVQAILGTTVCGVLDPDIPLGKLAVFDDLFFPDNRLPDGEICTIYDEAGQKERGHFLFDSPFCESMRKQIIHVTDDPITHAAYGHVLGPRFNSKAEIAFLRGYATYISQTAGPETVLAGELEIPYVLVGFGVDYANGIKSEPTPVEVLAENLNRSKEIFLETIIRFLKIYEIPKFEGFVYRFD
jgi:5'-methylthioadenosine phosphorylase